MNRKWRQESVVADLSRSVLSRDRKTMKMVLTISAVFIVFHLPITIVVIGSVAYPQFGTGGKYSNPFLKEIVNTHVNVSIHYKMRAKFS
ncbi:allatostatin-A receptor [Biomphalaria glabrata]